MDLITRSAKGTVDILPDDSYKWIFVEDIMKSQAKVFGFREIRTPVFEHTELFERSVGETSDVVQKEMYTFEDKGGRSVTLRPEGTAGAVRAILEHGIYNQKLPIKVDYLTSCYRYEKPQAGRLREFHQFGVEVLGSADPISDAELIMFAKSVFERLGIENISLEINSIGCPECRKKYCEALKEFFEPLKEKICKTCCERLDKNPMRILDCKSEECAKFKEQAPSILDFLCDECQTHFEEVKKLLDNENIEYEINPRIVRGLDYYTKTVFEFVPKGMDLQGTVCAGGRYDGLASQLSDVSMPAIGLAFGMERLLMMIDELSIEIPKPSCDVYIASVGEDAKRFALTLTNKIRDMLLIAECDLMDRKVKAQMKYANKIGARFCIVVGDSEIESKKVSVKNMITGEEHTINVDDNFLSEFARINLSFIPGTFNDMEGCFNE